MKRTLLKAVALFAAAFSLSACNEMSAPTESGVTQQHALGGPLLPISDPCPTCDGVFLTGDAADFNICAVRPGSDGDYDGVSDSCERKLAAAFAPQLYTSPTDKDLTRETYWAAQLSAGGEPNTIMIIYLLGYHTDTGGWPYGHNGDSEWIQEKVTYDWNDNRWKLLNATYSAHYMTGPFTDQTTTYYWTQLQYATDPVYGYLNRDYPIAWVSRDKHANYQSLQEPSYRRRLWRQRARAESRCALGSEYRKPSPALEGLRYKREFIAISRTRMFLELCSWS